ncbi:MAG: phosphatase PAP2 family protein [Calditrichaeota bacterium]|nr:MAG: phosphatase PAP2 family protein [Calditrichota bacterium]
MLEKLVNWDTFLFFLINRDLQNKAFNFLMPIVTDQRNWIPVFLFIIIALLWKGGHKGRMVILLMIPVILLSDQLSSSLFKPLVDRLRPCEAYGDLGMVNMLIGMKTSPSFPSSHAANSAAAATLLGHYYPRFQWLAIIIAATVSFSRVYVGVHYPFDVIAGAFLGCLCAFSIYFSYELIEQKSKSANR